MSAVEREVELPCEPASVVIVCRGPEGAERRSIRACQGLRAGQVVMAVRGREAERVGQHSLQISARDHLVADEPALDEEGRDRYPWRFLNHACDPNVLLRGRSLVARRDIAAGEELSLNYLASEARMAEPFACGCEGCELIPADAAGQRWIRGYAALRAEQRAQLPYACPWLKAGGPQSG